ncbi:hypothetical protein [Methylorubrum populi]
MKGPRSAMSSAISCMTRSQKLLSPEAVELVLDLPEASLDAGGFGLRIM